MASPKPESWLKKETCIIGFSNALAPHVPAVCAKSLQVPDDHMPKPRGDEEIRASFLDVLWTGECAQGLGLMAHSGECFVIHKYLHARQVPTV